MLHVGGVQVDIRYQGSLLEPGEPEYQPFVVRPLDGPPLSVLSIQVLDHPCPGNDSPVLFDSGGPWRMQSEAGGYRPSFSRGDTGRKDAGQQYMIAVADADTGHTRVFVRQDEDSDIAPDGPPVLGAESGRGEDARPLPNPVCYPLDQLLLMNHLASRGGAIVHAAGLELEGRALVFPGVSMAGKSTLARLLVAGGLEDALLSDDRVILRTAAEPGRFLAWGTPWPGDAKIARNASAPLEALVFLVHAGEDRIVPVDSREALRRLLPMVSCPWYDRERFPAVLETCGRVAQSVPCYELQFRATTQVVDLLRAYPWTGADAAR